MATNFKRVAGFIGDNRRMVRLPIVNNTTAIAVGDLVAFNGTTALSFTDLSDVGSKAQNQAAAHLVFAGIAQTPVAAATVSGSVLVAIEGRWSMVCTSGTYKVGDLIGPEGTGSGGNVGVSPTTVVGVASDSLSIGRCSLAGTTVTSIMVDIVSQLMQPTQAVLSGGLVVGSTDAAVLKGIYDSGTIAVTVPSIANDAAENGDSVDVDISSLTFAAAVGDGVIAIPLGALPTDCLLAGAYVTATDTVRVTFMSKEAGGGVTGAAVNFAFLIFDRT